MVAHDAGSADSKDEKQQAQIACCGSSKDRRWKAQWSQWNVEAGVAFQQGWKPTEEPEKSGIGIGIRRTRYTKDNLSNARFIRKELGENAWYCETPWCVGMNDVFDQGFVHIYIADRWPLVLTKVLFPEPCTPFMPINTGDWSVLSNNFLLMQSRMNRTQQSDLSSTTSDILHYDSFFLQFRIVAWIVIHSVEAFLSESFRWYLGALARLARPYPKVFPEVEL